jgi:hypothetical protein
MVEEISEDVAARVGVACDCGLGACTCMYRCCSNSSVGQDSDDMLQNALEKEGNIKTYCKKIIQLVEGKW